MEGSEAVRQTVTSCCLLRMERQQNVFTELYNSTGEYDFFFLRMQPCAFHPSAFLVCQAGVKVGNGVCVDRDHHRQLVSAFFIG